MQPILNNTNDSNAITNGYIKQQQQQMDDLDGTKSFTKHVQQIEEGEEEKVVLPVEMACMVPLKTMIGKLVRKSHADLMTLVDT